MKASENAGVRNSSALELLFALLPSWVALAWLISKAQWYWSNRPEMQFGWIVVMLSAYLIWEAWEKRPAGVFRLSFFSVAAGLAGGSLLLLFQIYQAAFGMMPANLAALALAVGFVVSANLAFVFGGKGARHFAFGFAFLLVAMPLPSAVHGPIVTGLQRHITTLNVEVLNLLGVPARRIGSIIQLPACQVGVDEACSGIRSLQSTVMATLFIGYLMLRRTSLRVLLFGAGLVLAFVGNLIRSLVLSYSANVRGAAAVEELHDAAGWSILLFTAVGVAVLSWVLSKVERKMNDLEEELRKAGPEPAAAG